eukprot:TCONS_00051947-protein
MSFAMRKYTKASIPELSVTTPISNQRRLTTATTPLTARRMKQSIRMNTEVPQVDYNQQKKPRVWRHSIALDFKRPLSASKILLGRPRINPNFPPQRQGNREPPKPPPRLKRPKTIAFGEISQHRRRQVITPDLRNSNSQHKGLPQVKLAFSNVNRYQCEPVCDEVMTKLRRRWNMRPKF